jgi:hypothetical protein
LVQVINCAEMKALPIQRWDDLLIRLLQLSNL